MISLTKNNNIYIVTLENSPVNALSLDFVSELSLLIQEIANDESTRGLLFNSSLEHFCAGADLKERSIMTDGESINTVYTLKSFFSCIYDLPFPTICLVNGACMGGGLELALSCDFRIASDNAFFALPESRLGIIPGAGGTQLLPRIVGIQVAKKIIYSGEKINSDYALKIGLIDEICNLDNLIEKGEKMMSSFLSSSKHSIKASKTCINEGFNMDIKSSLNIEFREYIQTLDTNERKQALKKYKKD